MYDVTPEQIVDFWFSDPVKPFHFRKSPEFDQQIADRFSSIYEQAYSGKLADWMATPVGALALIITLDQFPRNMFRDEARSFEADGLARKAARSAIESGFEGELVIDQRGFLNMPFMHSEELADQEFSVEQYGKLGSKSDLKYAVAHRDIIARFGRFPHRNDILGRSSSADEIEFLKQPDSGF